jgi:RHS repeat-associated protein
MGQVAQLTSSLNDSQHPGTLASSISYSAAGAVAQMTYGNGLTAMVSYNNRLQPTQIATGTVLTMNYGYVDGSGTNNGNVMSWSASGTQSFSRTYTYDELNRLKTLSAPGETCSGLSWTYDIWANRTHQTTTGGTCGQSQLTINNLNRIVDTGYSYDAAGNLTAEPGRTYQYDAENRLASINNGSVATHVYNAEGQRVRKTAGGTTTEYIYGPGGVVAEKVGSTWTVGYVYLNGALLAQYKNGTTYFALKDHLGSTRVLTTVSGTVYESYDYAPYGEPVGTSGAGTTRKFTGKERDSESGLDYFGARYYVSLSGRFLTPDWPFIDQQPGNPQSWNLYHYARNNPLAFTDPTGNYSQHTADVTRPMEGGEALNSFGNSTCMRCEEYSSSMDIAEVFAVFDAIRKAQQQSGITATNWNAGNFVIV